jgi:hypothetical protein
MKTISVLVVGLRIGLAADESVRTGEVVTL